MNRNLKKIGITPFLGIIWIYKKFITPFTPKTCRYEPSCSTYTKDALIKHGIIKGSWLGVKRILSCNPWGGSGYDPVP